MNDRKDMYLDGKEVEELWGKSNHTQAILYVKIIFNKRKKKK